MKDQNQFNEVSSLSVRDIMEEDLQQLSRLFHSYFETKDDSFKTIDHFIIENRRTLDNYLTYLKEKNILNLSRYSQSEDFDIDQFEKVQNRHIFALKNSRSPEAKKLIKIKMDLTKTCKVIIKRVS